jgi:hypothetical protein
MTHILQVHSDVKLDHCNLENNMIRVRAASSDAECLYHGMRAHCPQVIQGIGENAWALLSRSKQRAAVRWGLRLHLQSE